MFGLAAIVLLAIAAFLEFTGGGTVSPAGLAYAGLACGFAHLLWPVTPWRGQP